MLHSQLHSVTALAILVMVVYRVPTSILTLNCTETPVTNVAYTVTPQPVDNLWMTLEPVEKLWMTIQAMLVTF